MVIVYVHKQESFSLSICTQANGCFKKMESLKAEHSLKATAYMIWSNFGAGQSLISVLAYRPPGS
jgi:hypothetical protein